MSPRERANVPASIHQRLLNRAKQEDRPLQELLQNFAIERFLFRLGRSPHAERLLLKGALMLRVWDSPLARPTRDVDLLGRPATSAQVLGAIVRECFVDAVPDDGFRLDPETVQTHTIRLATGYEGVRVRFVLHLGRIRVPMQVDVGFGDSVVPDPMWVEFPTLLDFPAPRLLAYPPESAVAEKFQAMVALGAANSRMKDFYDVWRLARRRDFAGEVLARALSATFERRDTPLPGSPPLALTVEFTEDRAKQAQWRTFLSRARLGSGEHKLGEIVTLLREFLMPPTIAAAGTQAFASFWPAGGPWQEPPGRR